MKLLRLLMARRLLDSEVPDSVIEGGAQWHIACRKQEFRSCLGGRVQAELQIRVVNFVSESG